jgi:hypothetical protein
LTSAGRSFEIRIKTKRYLMCPGRRRERNKRPNVFFLVVVSSSRNASK